MRSRLAVVLAVTALALSACGQRDENSEGNGPGNADGFGGRADPPVQAQPSQDQAQPTQDPPASERQPQQ